MSVHAHDGARRVRGGEGLGGACECLVVHLGEEDGGGVRWVRVRGGEEDEKVRSGGGSVSGRRVSVGERVRVIAVSAIHLVTCCWPFFTS